VPTKIKSTPWFTQPQVLHALNAIAESHGCSIGDRGFTSLRCYVAAGLLGRIHHAGGSYRMSLGTLAANLAVGETMLKDLLRDLRRFQLIEQSYSGIDARTRGKMLTFTLGPAALGERWESAWNTGTKLLVHEVGMKAKESKCGEWANSCPSSRQIALAARRPKLPKLHPLEEEKVAVRPIPTTPQEQKKVAVRLGTDGFGSRDATQPVETPPNPSIPAVRELAEPASIHPLEEEAMPSSSGVDRSRDEPGHQSPPPSATAPNDQVQPEQLMEHLNRTKTNRVKLIGGMRNPLNVEAGDQLMLKDQPVVVRECGYDWDSDEYTVVSLDTGEILRVTARRLSVATLIA